MREVSGRQIVLNVQLDEAERTARTTRADAIAARLQNGEDPQTVAAAEGLEVKQTNFFDNTSKEIENVDGSDVVQFRSQVSGQKDKPWTPIQARNNILLGHVLETRQGDLPPYEEVLDKARDNVIAEKKQTAEYKDRVAEYSDKLKSEMKKIDDINTIFPELKAVIGETTEPFTAKDSLFQYQLYVQAPEIHKAFRDKEPGAVAGPLSGFFGEAWFFELIERTPPTEEELAGLEGEREELKNRMVQTRTYELLAEFTKDLRERMLANVSYQQHTDVLDYSGRDIPEGEASRKVRPHRTLPQMRVKRRPGRGTARNRSWQAAAAYDAGAGVDNEAAENAASEVPVAGAGGVTESESADAGNRHRAMLRNQRKRRNNSNTFGMI